MRKQTKQDLSAIITYKDYIVHMRPRSWGIVAFHLIVGALLARNSDIPFNGVTLIYGAILWAVFLNGGTLALNSAVDNDEGDIGYLDNPPPVPQNLFVWGIGAMFLGCLLSTLLNSIFSIIFLICVIMSLVYSVPPLRLKAVGGADVCINSLGYGLLTILAGWSTQADYFTPFISVIGLGFGCLFSALYPLTQIYQYYADRKSGAKTLTVILGKERALLFSQINIHLSFTLFIFGFFINGIFLKPLVLLLPCWYLWNRLVGNWNRYRRSVERAKQGMYYGLWLWFLVEALIYIVSLGMH